MTLVEWMRRQKPERVYNWSSMTDCLVAQYLTEKYGLEKDRHKPWYRKPYNLGIRYSSLFQSVNEYVKVCAAKPHTIGAALERMKNA